MPIGAGALAANGNWPTVVVEICFNVDPFDPTPPAAVWTDVTKYVTAMSWSRGRQYELDKVEAQDANFTLRNNDGRFDPENTSSPYAPNVMLFRQIRVRASWAGTDHTVYRGYVERWPQRFELAGMQQWTDLVAVDALTVLGQNKLLDVYAADVAIDRPGYYYPCSDAAGSTSAVDQSGNGNAAASIVGTLGSFAFAAASVLPYDPSGEMSLQLTRSGANGRVVQFPDFGSGLDANPRAVEFWIETTDAPGADTAILVVWLNGVATTLVTYAAAGTIGGVAVNDGQPHQVVWEYPGTTRTVSGSEVATHKIWVDGTLATSTLSGPVITADGGHQVLQLGGSVNPNTSGPTGLITCRVGQVSIWWGATLPAESRWTDHYHAGRDGFAGDLTGTRVGRVLDWAGWTGGRSLDAGLSTVQAADIAGSTATDVLQQVAEDENGLVFVDGSGSIVFSQRSARYNSAPAYTFGEASLPYSDFKPDYDPTHVHNDVTVVRTGGITARVADAASKRRYGTRPLDRTIGVTSDGEAVDAANYLLNRYKEPQTRVSQLVVQAASNPALWPAVLNIDVGARIDVTRKTQWGTKTYGLWVENVAHDVAFAADGAHWTVTYVCSPADLDTYLILDSPTYGLLDSGNKLSY